MQMHAELCGVNLDTAVVPHQFARCGGGIEIHAARVPFSGQAATSGSQPVSNFRYYDPQILTRTHKIEANLERHAREKSAAHKIKEKLDNLKMHHDRFSTDSEFEMSLLSPLSVGDIVTFEIRYDVLQRKLTEIETMEAEARLALSRENSQSLVMKKEILDAEINAVRQKLDEPNRLYQAYLAELDAWQKQKLSIVGDSDTPESLEYLKNELGGLSDLPKILDECYKNREKCSEEIYLAKAKLAASYREIYRPVQDFIQSHEIAQKNLDLQFEVAMTDVGFGKNFLSLVDQRKAGTFCGGSDAQSMLTNMLEQADFDDKDKSLEFIQKILEALKSDQRKSKDTIADPENQLKSGATLEELYNFVCSLDFIEPRYVLKLGGKSLDQLSPGEKGTLLIIFYLLIDKRDIPLIIDQPEGNLDSETVFKLLVPCVKEAKSRRQIILVTHNPNLAVVCDAEQIIYAEIDKVDGNRITYTSGAIENPEINLCLSNVLEGTLDAFRNRDGKYQKWHR